MLKELIDNGFESERLDFMERMYPKHGTPELLKDILAMANSNYTGTKYNIMGVKDKIGENRIISGIYPEEIVDSASYQQFIINNIEPDVEINIHYVNYQKNKIAVIEILDSNLVRWYTHGWCSIYKIKKPYYIKVYKVFQTNKNYSYKGINKVL